MENWILAALALYLLGEYLPSLIMIGQMGVMSYLASRDAEPEPGLHRGRLMRAARNFRENLPVFLALALLSMILPDANHDLALLGAQVFVTARLFLYTGILSGCSGRALADLPDWLGRHGVDGDRAVLICCRDAGLISRRW